MTAFQVSTLALAVFAMALAGYTHLFAVRRYARLLKLAQQELQEAQATLAIVAHVPEVMLPAARAHALQYLDRHGIQVTVLQSHATAAAAGSDNPRAVTMH